MHYELGVASAAVESNRIVYVALYQSGDSQHVRVLGAARPPFL